MGGAADGWRLAPSSGWDSAFCPGYRGDGLPQTDSLPIRSAVDRGGGLPHPISNTTARRIHRWGGILPWPRAAHPLFLTMNHHGQAWRLAPPSGTGDLDTRVIDSIAGIVRLALLEHILVGSFTGGIMSGPSPTTTQWAL